MKRSLFTLLLTFFFGIIYSQNVIYVDSSVTSSGNGSSWSTALKTITEAIDSSSSGDTIKIAKGTYFEDTTLIIPHALMLRGGYPTGGGNTQDTSNNRIIIDGDNKHGIISNDGHYNISINHLILQNGNARRGGGIYNIGGILFIEKCVIRNNFAYQYGGGVCTFSDSALNTKIINSSICNNESTLGGGGIFSYSYTSSLITIGNCKIYNNKSEGDGGGVMTYASTSNISNSSSVIISNSSINNNASSTAGGGIYSGSSISSFVKINNCSIYKNICSIGGGIYCFANISSVLKLVNTILANNSNFYNEGKQSMSNDITYSFVSGTNVNVLGNIDGSKVDPLFLDSANENYRLQITSPLVNAGSNALIPKDEFDIDNDGNTSELLPLDIDGKARIMGNNVDIGAFETTVANSGIENAHTLDADVKIYPNPTSGIFILDFGNSKASFNITIVDVLGKTILEFDNKKAQEKIDLSTYANGVYFINIANEMGNKTIKLIKE